MTKPEFTGQFDRLCKGFKHEPTQEQTEAWYRRIGHVAIHPWAEAVTTLLCSKYFPKLEEALEAIEEEAERARKAQVAKEQVSAKKTYTLIQDGRIPGISTAYFQAVKAYAGRKQARYLLTTIEKMQANGKDPRIIEQKRLQWVQAEKELTHDLVELSSQLTTEENQALLAKYEAESVPTP